MRQKCLVCARAGLLDSLGALVSATAAERSKALLRAGEVE
jgi:hypothetical protein